MNKKHRFRLSPDFSPHERGCIVSAVKRGSSYSKQARIWSDRKGKSISWSTIRSICNRRGVKSSHPYPSNFGRRQTSHQELVEFVKKEKLFIALVVAITAILIILATAFG